MDPELDTRAAVYLFASPVIVALVQLAKGLGLPSRFAPLMALALGVLVAVGAVLAIPQPPQHWFFTGLIGVAMGLAASGIYSGVGAMVRPAPPAPPEPPPAP